MQSTFQSGLTLASVLVLACGGNTAGTDICQSGNGCASLGTGGSNVGGMLSSGGSAPAGGATSLVGPDYCDGLILGYCTPNLQKDVRAVNILLVLDESSSMNFQASSAGAIAKWSELKQALASALPTFESDISFGLELFPFSPTGVDTTSPDSSCSVQAGASNPTVNVEIAPGAANVAAITSVLNNQTPAGSAPMAQALQQAYTYFTQGNGKDLAGTRSLILVTDGGPNCNDLLQCAADTCTQNLEGKCGTGLGTAINCCDANTPSGTANKANLACLDEESVIAQIANLEAAGVATYVIGIPGSEPYAATLNRMATAGGVPNPAGATGQSYYPVSASNCLQDLRDAISGILTARFQSCDIGLKYSPANPMWFAVLQDCEFVPPLPGNMPPAVDGGVIDGYYIDYTQSPAHLVLTGTYCNSIIGNAGRHIDVFYACHGVN